MNIKNIILVVFIFITFVGQPNAAFDVTTKKTINILEVRTSSNQENAKCILSSNKCTFRFSENDKYPTVELFFSDMISNGSKFQFYIGGQNITSDLDSFQFNNNVKFTLRTTSGISYGNGHLDSYIKPNTGNIINNLKLSFPLNSDKIRGG